MCNIVAIRPSAAKDLFYTLSSGQLKYQIAQFKDNVNGMCGQSAYSV